MSHHGRQHRPLEWSAYVKRSDTLTTAKHGMPGQRGVKISIDAKNCHIVDRDVNSLVEYLSTHGGLGPSVSDGGGSSSSGGLAGGRRVGVSRGDESQASVSAGGGASGPGEAHRGVPGKGGGSGGSAEPVSAGERIISIDLSTNGITGQGVATLMNFLKSCARPLRLKCLKLFKNSIDDAGARAIADFVVSSDSPLEELHLSHNRISRVGAGAVFRAFSTARRGAADASSGNGRPGPAVGDFVYPRHEAHIRLPVWVRLEYNQIEDPEELMRDWKDFHFRTRNLTTATCRVPQICFAERDTHVKNPHCSPIRCVHSLKTDAPILHLYSFNHQGNSSLDDISAVGGVHMGLRPGMRRRAGGPPLVGLVPRVQPKVIPGSGVYIGMPPGSGASGGLVGGVGAARGGRGGKAVDSVQSAHHALVSGGSASPGHRGVAVPRGGARRGIVPGGDVVKRGGSGGGMGMPVPGGSEARSSGSELHVGGSADSGSIAGGGRGGRVRSAGALADNKEADLVSGRVINHMSRSGKSGEASSGGGLQVGEKISVQDLFKSRGGGGVASEQQHLPSSGIGRGERGAQHEDHLAGGGGGAVGGGGFLGKSEPHRRIGDVDAQGRRSVEGTGIPQGWDALKSRSDGGVGDEVRGGKAVGGPSRSLEGLPGGMMYGPEISDAAEASELRSGNIGGSGEAHVDGGHQQVDLPLYIFLDGTAFLEMRDLRKGGLINPFSLPGLLSMCRKKVLATSKDSQGNPNLPASRHLVLMLIDAANEELNERIQAHPLLMQRMNECRIDFLDELIGTYGVVEWIHGFEKGQPPVTLDSEEISKAAELGLSSYTVAILDFAYLWAQHLQEVSQKSPPMSIILTANPTVIKLHQWLQRHGTHSERMFVHCVELDRLNRSIRTHFPALCDMLSSRGLLQEALESPFGEKGVISSEVLQAIITQECIPPHEPLSPNQRATRDSFSGQMSPSRGPPALDVHQAAPLSAQSTETGRRTANPLGRGQPPYGQPTAFHALFDGFNFGGDSDLSRRTEPRGLGGGLGVKDILANAVTLEEIEKEQRVSSAGDSSTTAMAGAAGGLYRNEGHQELHEMHAGSAMDNYGPSDRATSGEQHDTDDFTSLARGFGQYKCSYDQRAAGGRIGNSLVHGGATDHHAAAAVQPNGLAMQQHSEELGARISQAELLIEELSSVIMRSKGDHMSEQERELIRQSRQWLSPHSAIPKKVPALYGNNGGSQHALR